mgnify:CR=1 FL=1
MKLDKIIDNPNIALDLDEEELVKIGAQVVDGFDQDLESRKPWEDDLERWTKLALQISDKKTYPWPNASNVKFPLLATAAMQFAARAYPSLVPSDGMVVRCQVVGYDQDGQKGARAERISKHMSYQLLYEMQDWEEDMDRLLLALPIIGTVFKKTYWDSEKQVNVSRIVYPRDLVVNYWATSLEEAERKTEIIPMSKRKLREKQLAGLYRDVKLADPQGDPRENKIKDATALKTTDDANTTPYYLLEQHTFLDLDDDGYAEPYVVVVDYNSRTVLRIAPRFTNNDIIVDDKGNVTAIKSKDFYTKFSFVPNPDGGFYDIGFGRLLGTINASADTIINQIIDSGSLSNLQSGFLGKGLRIRMGETRFSPGEWKAVNATGDDLKKQILPLPTNPPSPVLFQLLELLLQSGKELASVAEIFVGKMPGQNTPATTTMASIEQGMKVFTAVYKRVFRSLAKEFRKLYALNAEYLNPETELAILDLPIKQSDYEGDPNDVIPNADPAAVSQQEKQAKAQMLVQMLGMGTINPMSVTQFMLEAYEIPNAQMFLMQPQQQQGPSPEEMKMQIEQQKAQAKIQGDAAKLQMQQAAEEKKQQMETAAKEQELKYKMIEHAMTAKMAQDQHLADMQQQQDQHMMNMHQTAMNHQQSMVHADQAAQAKQQQAKQQKPKQKGKPNK